METLLNLSQAAGQHRVEQLKQQDTGQVSEKGMIGKLNTFFTENGHHLLTACLVYFTLFAGFTRMKDKHMAIAIPATAVWTVLQGKAFIGAASAGATALALAKAYFAFQGTAASQTVGDAAKNAAQTTSFREGPSLSQKAAVVQTADRTPPKAKTLLAKPSSGESTQTRSAASRTQHHRPSDKTMMFESTWNDANASLRSKKAENIVKDNVKMSQKNGFPIEPIVSGVAIAALCYAGYRFLQKEMEDAVEEERKAQTQVIVEDGDNYDSGLVGRVWSVLAPGSDDYTYAESSYSDDYSSIL